jgi:preprotein translocase subunit SecA
MDELRRGIGLRAIGQKDPLVEYQFESYNLFQQTLQGVREKVTEFALRVAVASRRGDSSRRPTIEGRNPLAQGRKFAGASSAENVGDELPQPVQKGKKVGRNDPCPCGSGKKYKHCCGGESKPVHAKNRESLL